jgi:hypothetical protein
VIDAAAGDHARLLLTDEELDSLEKRAGDGEIARGGRPGGSEVASPPPAARHGAPTQVFHTSAAPADGRPRVDGCWSRICAVASGAAGSGQSLSSDATDWAESLRSGAVSDHR